MGLGGPVIAMAPTHSKDVSALTDPVSNHGPSTRRALLSTTAAFALSTIGGTQFADPSPSPAVSPMSDDDPWQNWSSNTNRLVRRISMGITAVEAAKAAKMGYTTYLEEQLDANAINDAATESVTAQRWPRTTWSAPQLYGLLDDWVTTNDLVQSTVYRAVRSRRQLQERMVEFWCDHFSMWSEKATGGTLVPFVRDVVRPNALGNFPTLLRKVIGCPAMLVYLDNVYNYGDQPNINFAREILELHTVSVTGGYTSQDIKNLARALTGWSVDDGVFSLYNKGKFLYRPYYHSPGNKVVMGHQIPSGQQDEGESVVAFLAMHPKTAEFISKKLVRWFVSHDPDPALVQQATSVYLSTGGDIKSVLRVILAESVVSVAPPKLKRPFHLVTSALRGNVGKLDNLDFLRWVTLYSLGHVPFSWEPPDGYPDRVDFWAASMRPRLQFGFNLANNEVWGIDYQPTKRPQPLTRPVVLDMINRTLFGGEMSNHDRGSVSAFLTRGPLDETLIRSAYAVALASPSFQWY